jgi:hypothetical protein
VLHLQRVPPATAVAIWMAALALRAAASVLVIAYIVLYFPGTALFDVLTHWCWHAVVPALTTHFGLDATWSVPQRSWRRRRSSPPRSRGWV